MRKIEILTLNRYFNNGNRLPIYALQEYLKQQHFETETLRVSGRRKKSIRPLLSWVKKLVLRPLLFPREISRLEKFRKFAYDNLLETKENKMMKDLVSGNWGKGYFKSFTSDFTADVFNETEDITLGDGWLPEYTVDSKGNNVVIVRNPETDELIKDSIRDKKIKIDKVSLETIFRPQSSHYRHWYEKAAYRLYLVGKQNI